MKLAAAALAALLLAPACPAGPKEEPPTVAPEAASPASAAPRDLAATCCAQCDAAASTDPAGFDISLLNCLEYDRRPDALSAECKAWFARNPRMVQDCR